MAGCISDGWRLEYENIVTGGQRLFVWAYSKVGTAALIGSSLPYQLFVRRNVAALRELSLQNPYVFAITSSRLRR